MTQAALGCSAHAGWAVIVALAGEPAGPRFAGRWRVALIDPALPRQAYHAGEGRPLDYGLMMVRKVEASALDWARTAVATILAELRARGHEAVAAGVGTLPLPSIERVMASHPLRHAAEGELYREALAEASAAAGLAVRRFLQRELPALAASTAGSGAALEALLGSLGRSAGRPWTKDEKHAAMAALLALPPLPPGP